MGFKLIQQVSRTIEATSAKESFALRSDAIENLLDSTVHVESNIEYNAKAFEVFAFTAIGVNNHDVVFPRIEHDSIPFAPFVHFRVAAYQF